MARSQTQAEELLAAARAGNAIAWGQLLERYRPYLLLLAEVQIPKLLRVKAEPLDLVQETLLQAHQDFPAFRGHSEGEFLSWLREILATRLSRLSRRYLTTISRNARLEKDLFQVLNNSSRVLDRLLTSSSGSPSATAGRHEEAVQVAAAMEKLSEDHRKVLVLRHMEGLTFAKTGERMNRSEDAARKLWARAVQLLQAVMQEEERDNTKS